MMKFSHFFTFITLFLISLTLAIGCNQIQPNSPTSERSSTLPLTVSAAASLQDALEAIDSVFEQGNPTIQVSYNFGASGSLQQQIEQGAPTDIFISAAAKQMDALQNQDFILPKTRRDLLANRLVLIVPKDSALNLTTFPQIAEANVSKIAVGEPRSVPAGQYAEEVFKNLNLTEALKPKFVFANNVRGVLAAVESGNVDAGVVYETDAKLSDRVKIAAIASENLHQPIVYPIAVMKSSPNIAAAKTYTQFLFETQARTIFQQFGFGTPES